MITTPPAHVTQCQSLAQARLAVWSAWFEGDTLVLRKLLSPNVVAIDSSGWSGFDAILNESRAFAARGRALRIEFPRVTVQRYGNTAVIYSEYHLLLGVAGRERSVSGRATEVFSRGQNGCWLNTGWQLDQTT